MCGVAGVLRKEHTELDYPVGRDLLTLASCLQHRGSDSAGFAVFGRPEPSPRLQVILPAGTTLPEPQVLYAAVGGHLADLKPTPDGYSAAIAGMEPCSNKIEELVRAVEAATPGATVAAAGSRLSIAKTVGVAAGLEPTVSRLHGTHGIAHLRLATESRIDPTHAQPFWARGFFDIAVTHNGHITNYHKMRQQYEARGMSLSSANDSEIIGVYLGDKMAEGASFEDALIAASHDLDGSFSFIAATQGALGVARDAFATKPLLCAENDAMVALASEQRALRRLMGDSIVIREIQPKETRTWATA